MDFAVIIVLLALNAVLIMRMQPSRKPRAHKPGPVLKFLIIDNIKIKNKGGSMEVSKMNPKQSLIGQVEFKNRKGDVSTVQAGTVNYKLKTPQGEEVPAEEGTVSAVAENEYQFKVLTSENPPPTKKLWEVWAGGDADKDDDEEKIVEGPVLSIVFEELEAETVSSATIIQQPTDVE